ncbi:YfhO family protein [Streptomyces sp. NPDC003077]|uniref:YfhO family protein n=1 Tax=Streptomyces sp. NPDC003077 TaxID=3154443 RepID=UPI0033A0F0D5
MSPTTDRRTAPAPAAARRTAGTGFREAGAAGLAAGLSMGAYCLAMAVHGTYPFGARSRAVNDLGNQFVPFHARLWDLMHGRTTGDLLFNWGSGYGVPFLADFLSYLMNPFSWLVGLFPRHLVELPVFLVTLLSMGLAAALMTVFLGRLRPGPGLPRALLAVGYGVSAWVLGDGAADPMWMWGPVSLPLLGIAGDWCLRRRRWVPGALLVALAWAGNFYTAAMASLAMALVLLVRLLLAEGCAGRDRVRVLARAASMGAVGVLLAAPVLTVTSRASETAMPAPPAEYRGGPPLPDYLAHLLPGGRGEVPAPNVAVGVLALLLLAAFPFVRAIPLRVRAAWYGLALLVAASFVWRPTVLLWHGLALPNGSPYRAAFVLGGIVVLVAWLALSHRPRPGELIAGGCVVAVLVAVCAAQGAVDAATWVLVGGGGGVVLVALVGLAVVGGRSRAGRGAAVPPWGRAAEGASAEGDEDGYGEADAGGGREQAVGALSGEAVAVGEGGGTRPVQPVLLAVLACAVFLTSGYTALAVTAERDELAWYRPKTTLAPAALTAYAGLRARADWPASRADPGPHEFADNDPLLLAGEGGAYYSSYLPARTAHTLRGLGAGWYIQGRHTRSVEDPAARAILAVGSHLTGPTGRAATAHRSTPAPLVTVRTGGAEGDVRGDRLFARQELLLGADVYETPRPTVADGPGLLPTGYGWRLPAPDGGPHGGPARDASALDGRHHGGPTPGEPAARAAQPGAPAADAAQTGIHIAARSSPSTVLTASCAPGSVAYWYAPWYAGRVEALGTRSLGYGDRPMTATPVRRLGRVPPGGRVTVRLVHTRPQAIPREPIGCLSPGRLASAVKRLRARAPVRVGASGHGLTAELRPGSRGTAVVAVPAVPGWRCAVDGGPARAPRRLGGLMAVPLGDRADRLACSYRTPGLARGLAASGAAAVALAAVALVGAVRRRRDGGTGAPRAASPYRASSRAPVHAMPGGVDDTGSGSAPTSPTNPLNRDI